MKRLNKLKAATRSCAVAILAGGMLLAFSSNSFAEGGNPASCGTSGATCLYTGTYFNGVEGKIYSTNWYWGNFGWNDSAWSLANDESSINYFYQNYGYTGASTFMYSYTQDPTIPNGLGGSISSNYYN